MYFYIQAEVNDIEETRNMGKAAEFLTFYRRGQEVQSMNTKLEEILTVKHGTSMSNQTTEQFRFHRRPCGLQRHLSLKEMGT